MSVKFNYRAIATKVAKSPRGIAQIERHVKNKFVIAKDKFIDDFSSHPVTKDLEAGFVNPEANIDSAGILGGYGNLYAFLGLQQIKGEPTEPIKDILESETKLTRGPLANITTTNVPKIRVVYSIRTPRQKLFELTRLFWDNGLSWLYSLETGISGLSHFISKARKGRSYGGLQVAANQGGPDTVKTPYFNKLLRNFVSYFKSL